MNLHRTFAAFAAFTVVIAATGLSVGQAAAAPPAEPPPQSRAFGSSLQAAYSGWLTWALTAPDAPLLNDCGERVGRVFYLSSALDTGQRGECSIPTGVPIVSTPGSYFSYYLEGETPSDEEILEEVTSFDDELVDTSATLDGRPVRVDAATTPVLEVANNPTSFVSTTDPAAADDASLTIAASGYVMRLGPLPPGHHTLVMTTTVDFLDLQLDVTYDLHVG